MSVERFPKVPSPAGDAVREMDLAEIAGYAFTDDAVARRFADEHGEGVRYVGRWRRWVIWNALRWLADESGSAVDLLRDTLRNMLLDYSRESDERARGDAIRRIELLMRGARVKEILDLARWQQGIVVLPQIFDGDPWLLNVRNGTVDLRTGKLRPHDREDFITKIAPVEFDTEAECPRWVQFLERIFDGKADLIEYLKRSVGYGLTGVTSEQVLFLLHGSGANGKSTLLNALLELLGDYGMQAAPDLLMARRDDSHPTAIADLAGRRLVAAVEVDESRRLAESLVKTMTGGDRIRSRRMREDYSEFKPTHKLVLACNHKPVVRGTDRAIWRRIHLLPFNVTIPEPEQDKNLPDKLKTEAPGILRWAVEGCLAWQRDGLNPPSEVIAATQEYRAQQDVLGGFLEAECVTGNGSSASKAAFAKAYREWCERNGDKPLGRAELRLRLLERGVTEDRDKRARFWTGIGLVEDSRSGDGDNG